MKDLNSEYWSDRYKNGETGWDLGNISPPLKAYFDQLENKKLKILIPGCGRGYEGIYLLENGFINVFLADYSREALNEVKKNAPDFPDNNLLCANFFDLEGLFDLIIEQTLFCAIDPALRDDYVTKMEELLSDEGKVVGLLFNKEFEGGPPFGGEKLEYEKLFSESLQIELMEGSYNSALPRMGNELFFIAKKRK